MLPSTLLTGKDIICHILITLAQYPIISVILLLISLIIGSYYAIRPKNLPPGPWGIPWIGSPHIFGDDVHKDFDRLAQKYGPIYTIMMGIRPMIIVNNSKMIRELFVRNADMFSNRPVMFDLDQNEMFDELFNVPYSEEWKNRKKIMTRIHRGAGFGSGEVEQIFQKTLDKMYVEIDKFEGKPFRMNDAIHELLVITICEIVFNGKFEYGDPEVSQVRGFAVAWVDSMYRCGMSVTYWTDNVPIWICKILFPTLMEDIRKSGVFFQEFLVKRIEEHRETYDANNLRDVIDGYLKERGNDADLPDQVLACNIFMLFPDAIDSTGNLLEFIVFYLAYYPDWQRKVQEQIAEVCGDRRPALADRPNMPLVEATMYEAGRIANVVSLTIAHCPQEDTTYEGYSIPRDCYILGNLYAAHMDKDIFPQGERFAPETLIRPDGTLQKNPKIMYFGIGRRMCIGELMVKNEAFLFISNVLQRYNLAFPEGEPLPSTETQGGLIRAPMPYKVRAIRRVPNDEQK